ncbi:MAG: FtsX-like permease family protein [Cyclobacteriaceae bacterium]
MGAKTTKAIEPPKWANRFLEWFCSADQLEILQGDLYETFQFRLAKSGPLRARLLFIKDVFDLMRPFAFKRKRSYSSNNRAMLKNYFKISYRNFLSQKIYSLINISGLAIGLACFLLIYLYVQDELSYDSMHSKADRTYRVLELFESDGVGEHSASNPFGVGPTLINDYPHLIESMVRLFNFQAPVLSLKNPENNREFNESRLFLADSTLFDVFDFEMLVGNKETALDGPNSIILTESLAYKYFGDDDPLGKQLIFQGEQPLLVNGIMADAPLNSHFQFDAMISYSTIKHFVPASWMARFYWNPNWTYITLHDNSLKAELETQLIPYKDKYFPEDKREHISLQLQPLLDIHLHSNLDYEIQANGSASNIYVFSTIALFVLFIASINFINLSTARATKRAKEVGIRKTLGSKKSQLVKQFIFESLLYTFSAMLLAILAVLLILPFFNVFTEKAITLVTLLDIQFIIAALVTMVSVGLISGIYPALVLSSFDPVKVLKGGHLKSKGFSFRKVLVTIQFAISILLIVGTIMAVKQLDLLQDNNLGFDKEQVIMVPIMRTPIGENFETIRQEMLKLKDIQYVTAVEEIVGAKNQVGMYHFEGMEVGQPFPRLSMRHDFLETFGMELISGRNYSEDFETDDEEALLINETLARQMGWTNEEAIGKYHLRSRDRRGKVVGVVKDFNYASKHQPISSLVMDLSLSPSSFRLFIKYMAIRVSGQNINESLGELERVWKDFIPDRPFQYFFLDSRLAESYKAEEKLSLLTAIFAGLAILVACLGLFGLATFTTEQRSKEIGIRKVLGIKGGQIIGLLSKDFMRLILLAILITVPATYFLVNSWLDGFAYRVSLEIMPFVIATITVLTIAFVTVAYQALRAVSINPVRILKDE